MDKTVDFVRDTSVAICSGALDFCAAVSKKALALAEKGKNALKGKCSNEEVQEEPTCPCTALLQKWHPTMKIVMLAASAVALVSGLCFFLGKKK